LIQDENAIRTDGGKAQKQSSLQKAASLSNLPDQELSEIADDILIKLNIEHADNKLSLYDKKKLKWASDAGLCFASRVKTLCKVAYLTVLFLVKDEKSSGWNPFGRPGGGAPNYRTTAQLSEDNLNLLKNLSKNQAATTNDNNTMQQRLMDQSKVPAAMRTSVFFGDVKYEDDIKKTKELERKKWLLELELQKKEKFIEKEFGKERDRLNELKQELELSQPPPQQQRHQQPPRQQQNHHQTNYVAEVGSRETLRPFSFVRLDHFNQFNRNRHWPNASTSKATKRNQNRFSAPPITFSTRLKSRNLNEKKS
jgi:hypothetical protein